MNNSKNKISKQSKYIILIAVAVLGVALLILGNLLESKQRSYETTEAGLELTDAEKYALETENKIKELCRQVKGVDNITVVVTLKGSYSAVYASQGLIGYKMPEIQGIGIVCAGGGNPEIQQSIVSLVSASTGLSTNKIYVCEAES